LRSVSLSLGAAVLAAAFGACGPTASVSTSSPGPPATAVSSDLPTPGSTAPATGSGARVDASLVAVLPADVDGVRVEFSPEASEETIAGGNLPPQVDALAFGLAATPEDFVIASVVRLDEGAFDDGFYRDWRASYAEGVCGPAGGVGAGTAEAGIGGRNVFIGSCVNGGHTYVTWLEDRSVIVSAYAVGDRRLGERLMETLEE
jgi:hypothetical protein